MIDLGRISLEAALARRAQLAAELGALDNVIAAIEAYLAVRDDSGEAVRSGAVSPIESAVEDAAEPEPGDLPPVASAPATEQPERGSRRPTPVRVGSPAPVSRSTTGRVVDSTEGWTRCPECGERVRAQGLGAHRTRSKRHAAAVNGPTVPVRPPAPQERPATERNPRSTPPLDLPRRLDQAVGE